MSNPLMKLAWKEGVRIESVSRFSMVGFALCALLACGEAGVSQRHPYSLIWISLDTLRADHLGLYGYERDTSPFLDELGRRGLYFEWVVAPASTTLPVHVTMFSGYHPLVHQVIYSRKENPGVRIAETVRTLPQVLHDAGFATRAWVDGGKMAAHHGFYRGFDDYDDQPTFLPEKLAMVLETLGQLGPDDRFFFLVHTYQIHHPYGAPPPYNELFVTNGHRTEAQRKLDLYDGCIRFVDDQLRSFVGQLEQRGVLDSTILSITSDHGEGFAEYGFLDIGHGRTGLHQNITRVPWLLLHPDPSFRNRRFTALAGLIDFPNTVLALLDLDEVVPGGGVDLFGPDGDAPREYLSATQKSWSLYAAEYHLLENEMNGAQQANIAHHFPSDPAETKPIEDAKITAALRVRLAAQRSALEEESRRLTPTLREFGPMPERQEGDRLKDQLRALGYID